MKLQIKGFEIITRRKNFDFPFSGKFKLQKCCEEKKCCSKAIDGLEDVKHLVKERRLVWA
jgi:hypothetical protein